MKNILFCVGLLCFFSMSYAQDVLCVKQLQVPILVDRQDNVLLYMRIDAKESNVLDEITLELEGSLSLNDIKAVKLYYGGTESIERKDKIYFAPQQYISRDNPNFNKSANPSYSVLKSEVHKISKNIILKANQELYNGVNYFWVSIELKTGASLVSTLSARLVGAKADNKSMPVVNKSATDIVRRLGIGVRHAGDDGVVAYRIPGLVTSNVGSLLAVYDVRYNNSVDLQEHVDVGLSRSTDGGKTWEPMRIVMSFGELGGLPKSQNGVGDPAILVDKKTGTIWVVAAWTHGMGNGRAWFNSAQGMNKEKTAQLVLSKSEDDGKTWSKPINITSQVKDPSWYFLLQGPGNGITMADGTLVFATQYIGKDRIPNAGIMYSKDRGKTWQIHNHAHTNTTEAQVVEVTPGVLMLNMRDNRGGSRAVYTTNDLGKTWVEHSSSRSALQEPVCMASLIKVAAEDNILKRDLLIFSNPNSTKDRKNITIKVSLDGGVTWLEENQVLLDEGYSWGYSSLSMIDNETVGIFYEASTAHMTFQAVKLKDLVKQFK